MGAKIGKFPSAGIVKGVPASRPLVRPGAKIAFLRTIQPAERADGDVHRR